MELGGLPVPRVGSASSAGTFDAFGLELDDGKVCAGALALGRARLARR